MLISSDLSKEVSSFNYLEVYIDTRLKYNAQIAYIKRKLSQICGVSFRLSKFLNYEAGRNMYSSCIFSVIFYCIGVWGGVSLWTSRCNGLKIIHKRIVKNLFSKIVPNNLWIFRQWEIFELNHTYKMNVASYMFNIFKQGKYYTLRSSLYMSYPSHNYHTRNSNVMLLPYPRVEAIRRIFDIPVSIKCHRSYPMFKNTLTDFYLSQY